MSLANINDIHASAMLVELSISQWSGRKFDRKTSHRIAHEAGVDNKVGAYHKQLVGGETLHKIKKKVNEIRAYHYRHTLPWSDNGPRVLPTDQYFDYMEDMQKFNAEYDALTKQFVEEYPFVREESKRMLGSLFDDEDYPSTDRIANKFGMDISILPMPTADDFRVTLAEDELEKVRQDIEQRTHATLMRTMNEVYDRVFKVLDSFIDRLEDQDTVFRNSLVDNAHELVDLLPRFNLTQDPKLDEIAERMRESLLRHAPDDLRQDQAARRQTFNAAKEIKQDALDFFNGAFA